MKKFLKNKATMIGSIVAAVVVLVLLVAFCVRPVSVGYTYTCKSDNDGTIKYHFNSFNKVTMSMEYEGEKEEEEGYYFVKDGKLVTVMADNKDDFKTEKEEILENWDTVKDFYTMEINAFKITSGDESANCGGAIATVVVLAVVEVALAGMAVASILLSKKK